MKDFALEVKGLPRIPGNFPTLEKDIQKAVEDALGYKDGKKLVGVSVCWDYAEEQEKIDFACSKDQHDRDAARSPDRAPVADAPDPTENMGALRTWMYNKEKGLLGPDEPP